MSRFKRKQSQVFWKYMESQDLGLPRETDLLKPREILELPAPLDDGEEKLAAGGVAEGSEDWNEPRDRERSASPRSYIGHRSQDSGFSDSERSEESGVDAYASRVERLRRARTRKSRRRRISEDRESEERLSPAREERDQRCAAVKRLDSLWAPTELPPHPRHTSTPKTGDRRGRKVSASLPRGSRRRGVDKRRETSVAVFDRRDADNDDEEAEDDARVPRMIGVSMADGECLGDFLYASEPPEDVFQASESATTSSGAVRRSSTHRTGENSNGQFAPVKSWLNLLAVETEGECGATLQSKALPRIRTPCSSYGGSTTSLQHCIQGRDSTLLTASATAAATKLLAKVEQFHQRYQSALKELNSPGSERSERGLIQSLEEEAFLLLSELGAPPPQRVRNLTSSKEVLRQLRELQNELDHVVDARLDFYVERIVRGLEEAPREDGIAARGALAGLTALGLGPGGRRGGRSVARCSGVRTLLTALISVRGQSSGSRDSRVACLRALGSVCCCAEAIEQLAAHGGAEILADLLSSEAAPEAEKMEATALVVQITAPWTDALGLPHLEPFAEELVRSLTLLAEDTACSQTLLLAAAALNNLARSPRCAGPMVARKTVASLLRSVRRSGGGSICLMEQVAALIGELARSSQLHPHLAEARASVALVCFLRMRPPGLEDAYRKLEATASEALARLCVHREVAQQVVDVGAINCVMPYNQVPTTDLSTVRKAPNNRYTRSLRIACKRAAEQIDAAKASDRACTLDRR
ncbi:protein inscuteable homolog [Diprion similis]|uniref:protein inscuteable homolog n=1 Tax=Diprion similis TaxID=362088 RepID=UPI001EF97369|nr:protein inscuteable homolog [Diprion similis]